MAQVSRVLMFHGTDICNNTLNIFTDLLADCFVKRGIDVGFVNLNSKDADLADEYVREINKGFDAAIAFNSYGYHDICMGDVNVFDYLNVPFYNWIVDSPNEHTDFMMTDMKNYHVICIDRNHVRYVDEHFPDVKSAHFIPLGGQRCSDVNSLSYEEFCKRKYDVSFCGSLGSKEKIWNLILQLPDDIKEVVLEVIEYMLADQKICFEDALDLVFEDKHIYIGESDFLELSQIFGLANQYVRQYVREEGIRIIADSGINLDIFGTGWDFLQDKGNTQIHGSISYKDTLSVAANSTISLNVMPLFKGGIHDRIPSSMLSGAAVVTDLSSYIVESMVCDGDSRVLFGIDDFANAPGIIDSALNNLEDTYNVAIRGNNYADHNLTWDNRCEELIEILRGN